MLPNKRPDDMLRITTPELAEQFINEQVGLHMNMNWFLANMCLMVRSGLICTTIETAGIMYSEFICREVMSRETERYFAVCSQKRACNI